MIYDILVVRYNTTMQTIDAPDICCYKKHKRPSNYVLFHLQFYNYTLLTQQILGRSVEVCCRYISLPLGDQTHQVGAQTSATLGRHHIEKMPRLEWSTWPTCEAVQCCFDGGIVPFSSNPSGHQ